MRYKELFDKNLTKSLEYPWPDYYNLLGKLNISNYDLADNFEEEIKGKLSETHADGYSWMCTDTLVGIRLYYWMGSPLAVGHQKYRKSDETITWVSKEQKTAFREFVLSHLAPDEEEFFIDVLGNDCDISWKKEK